MKKNKEIIQLLLGEAGITINGNSPFDIKVHNEELYNRILKHGTIALGEAYMDGWWDCENLDQFFHKVLSADLGSKIKNNWKLTLEIAWNYFLNTGRKSKAFEVGQRHYDIGNDLYKAMLDKRMVYTCGYWKNSTTLDEAQEAKFDLVCKKIGLKENQTVLDIGSGWGSFMGYAAEKYGANTTGVTISKEQKALADHRYSNLSVKTELQDYRDIKEKFDHIVSLGMFEHVGTKNYRTYMKVAHDSLKDDGLFLLHTIGCNNKADGSDPWLNKYIFPNGVLPTVTQIAKSTEGLFIIEDLHNFGTDYDKTLMAWYHNFNKNWDSIKSNYDERFYRMWKYYLLVCAGSFRARNIQLWQIVLSKKGVDGGHVSVR